MDLSNLTISKARELLDSGKITSVELTKYYLGKIKEKNTELNAFVTVCEDVALEQAKKADERIKKGEKSPLLGIPYSAKDSFSTKGIRTTASANMLKNYIPPYNATVIQKLEDAGAVLLGKNNMDAWGHGSSTENSDFGPTKNPYDLTRAAGGSSGGTAAAVAADLCIFGIGEDTGGSIRHPSGLCGIYGLKVTYGKVSRYGCVALASSLDTVGPMARSAEDIETILNVIKGFDEQDSTLQNIESKEDIKEKISKQKSLTGIKFALPKEYNAEGLGDEVKKGLEDLVKKIKDKGGVVEEVNIPSTKYGIAAYYILNTAETSTNLARYDGIRYGEHIDTNKGWMEDVIETRTQNLGAEAKRRIMMGTYVLSSGYYDAFYGKAQKVRNKLINEVNKIFEKYDAIISPVTAEPAFKLGENTSDPIKMYLEDAFTVTANLAGVTSLAIPYTKSKEGLPIGMQIIGEKWSEGMICEIAKILE